tara:strand:+ start:2656 stop:3039 length:384 start_codon:yes stop_codon:yes gene_type:complete
MTDNESLNFDVYPCSTPLHNGEFEKTIGSLNQNQTALYLSRNGGTYVKLEKTLTSLVLIKCTYHTHDPNNRIVPRQKLIAVTPHSWKNLKQYAADTETECVEDDVTDDEDMETGMNEDALCGYDLFF